MRVSYIPLPDAYDAGAVRVDMSPSEARTLLWEAEDLDMRVQTQSQALLNGVEKVLKGAGLGKKDAP